MVDPAGRLLQSLYAKQLAFIDGFICFCISEEASSTDDTVSDINQAINFIRIKLCNPDLNNYICGEIRKKFVFLTKNKSGPKSDKYQIRICISRTVFYYGCISSHHFTHPRRPIIYMAEIVADRISGISRYPAAS